MSVRLCGPVCMSETLLLPIFIVIDQSPCFLFNMDKQPSIPRELRLCVGELSEQELRIAEEIYA